MSEMRSTAEIEQLESEVAALKQQLATEKAARSARWRGILSWVLTVLAIVVTTLALLSIWTFRTLTNTDLFVGRVGSIIEQPEVAQAIGDRAAAQLVEAMDLKARIQDRLPPEAAVVAGPVTTAAQNYLAEGVTKLLGTEQFQQAWERALAAGHSASIAILSGEDTTAVSNSNGVIVLNLTPVINSLLAQGSDFLSELLGREITAPTVTEDTLDAAVAALEEQLGVDLPADFGQVVLFESENLAAAQQWYQTARILVWLAPLAALILIALAIVVSPRRSRTGLTIVVGVALLTLLVGVLLDPIENSIVNSVSEEGLRTAVSSAFDTVLSSLLTGIAVVVALGVLAALALFLMGNSRAAVAGRTTARRAPGLAATYPGWFLGGGAVLALLVLALLPGRSWGQFLLVLLLYVAFALAVLLASMSRTGTADELPETTDEGPAIPADQKPTEIIPVGDSRPNDD